jgi:enoyl-CoA hydratase/carnithine racemase
VSAVLFDKRGHVAWLTINRPEARNVMDAAVFVGLADAWEAVREDRDIRVAVLTGSGGEDFCCGGDLGAVIPLWTGQRQPETELEQRLVADYGIVDRVLLKDPMLDKPVVAAVNGRALGGGCELLQATDFRIAAEHAEFGLPEPKVGIVPGGGSMVRLARQIPWAHAMKLLLGGQPVSAREALAMGLVSEVVAPAQLLERAEAVAGHIASLAPLALQAIKRTALETHTLGWAEGFAFEQAQAGQVMGSKDAREGNRAFREKRPPRFDAE